MSIPTDPGAALVDFVDYIYNAGSTGITQRFANLYNMFNAGTGPDNLKLSETYDWLGIHTFQSTKLHILSSGAAFDLIFAVTTVFTADRTLTLDLGDANRTITISGNPILTAGTMATLAGAENLENKTLTTPTIASFANATHDHSNAAGGGNIPEASITDGAILARLAANETVAGSWIFQNEVQLPNVDPPTSATKINAHSAILARGLISGAAANVSRDYNISSATKNATGSYSVDLDFGGANPVVVANVQDTVGANDPYTVIYRTSALPDIDFFTLNNAGATEDHDFGFIATE